MSSVYELYEDIPDSNTQDGLEENIYSDAEDEEYEDPDNENEELYEDLDNPTLALPNRSQNKILPPQPPRKDLSKELESNKPKGKGGIQISPASLGLTSTRIKDMKNGLKKIGIFADKSTKGSNQLSNKPKKCETPQKKKPPPTIPKKSVEDVEEPIYSDVDEDIANEEELYANPDEMTTNEPSYPIIRNQPLPPIPLQPMNNNDVTLKIENFDWYWNDIDRVVAETKLKPHINKDGYFLVRKCKNERAEYVISLTCNSKICHVFVRKRPDNLYAIGNQKDQEMTFEKVWEMIHYYKNNCVELLPAESRNLKSGWVKLNNPVNK